MAMGDPGTGIMFIQVPSVHRGLKEKEWKIEDMGFIVRDFCMDPSQDLLVVIEGAPTTTPTCIALYIFTYHLWLIINSPGKRAMFSKSIFAPSPMVDLIR